MSLLVHAQALIHQAAARGMKPLMFNMNAATMRMAATELEQLNAAKRSLMVSLLLRLTHHKTPTALEKLINLPVVINSSLPDGYLALATTFFQPEESGAQPVQAQTQAPWPPPPENAPGELMAQFQKRERVEPDEGDEAPTIADLARGEGGLTPTAIIMKALEGVDDVKQVIVIRVHMDNSITLCLNSDVFSAQGYLQKASIYLHQQ